MEYSKIKVLVTDGGARQTLTIIHGLKKIGCHITVMCADKMDVCYVSRIPDRKILNQNAAGSYGGFEDFLDGLVKSGEYDVLLPVSEMTTNKVTLHEEEYKKYIRLACAPRHAYIQAFNKQRTFERAMAIGIPCPNTRRENQSVEDFLLTAKFPVIIKPRQGVGSIGFHKFNTIEDFQKALDENSFNPDEYVIQEFVLFENRISTNNFMDQKGQLCTTYACEVLRWYPVDAGTAVLIRTVDAPDLIENTRKLLQSLEWKGVANVGFMIDKNTGEAKLLEINGRIPASIKMSWLCGYNVARQLVEMAYDEDVIEYGVNTEFGKMTRHSHADFAWFVNSKDRFKARPSWFSWRDTADVVFWKDDPMPFFAYTVQRVFRFKEISNKKKHDKVGKM